MEDKPKILVTGASGFIGSYIIDYFKENYLVYGLARRSRKEANIPYHKNIMWIQCDVSNEKSVAETMNYLKNNGGVDFILHFAAFYDFSYKDNPAYDKINVQGTENMLKHSIGVCRKRFILASSLAACEFPDKGEVITEKTPADADYHYARSKKQCETLLKKYSEGINCAAVRLAAVFSDWCQYAPLYKFLSSWLGHKIDSRILAGKGESALPYIHVRELCRLLNNIFELNDRLKPFDVFNASSDDTASHQDLFDLATAYYFGEEKRAFHLPKILAYPGLIAKHLIKHIGLTCDEPFERMWMIKYIDRKLTVDASYTHDVLDWKITPRYEIKRRLLFLLEKMKRHQDEWTLKNEEAMKKSPTRANLLIYDNMLKIKENVIELIIRDISKQEGEQFTRYKQMEENDFYCFMSTFFHLLLATIRSNDRSLLLKYIDDIGIRRFAEGFEPSTLCATLNLFNKHITDNLLKNKEMLKHKQDIYDNLGLSIQIAQDEIEDLYDVLINKMPVENLASSSIMPECKELQKMVRQLSAFYQVAPDEKYQSTKDRL
jgi:nucleoside-diphosphate-sugar epimerase